MKLYFFFLVDCQNHRGHNACPCPLVRAIFPTSIGLCLHDLQHYQLWGTFGRIGRFLYTIFQKKDKQMFIPLFKAIKVLFNLYFK
jgi:hypothetical protein